MLSNSILTVCAADKTICNELQFGRLGDNKLFRDGINLSHSYCQVWRSVVDKRSEIIIDCGRSIIRRDRISKERGYVELKSFVYSMVS